MTFDDRSQVLVHTDYNPDKGRIFYEIPNAIALRIQPDGDPRAFTQCLADLLERSGENVGTAE
jgi:hypothetical protein